MTQPKQTAMEYRPLGSTGYQVSVYSLGAMVFGWRASEPESFAILDRAMDRGMNLVDTSNTYGNGRSEEILGRWLKTRPQGSRPWIATKFHYWREGDRPGLKGDTRSHILEQCEGSLRRLQVETIDLYQVHRPQSSERLEETLQALGELVQSGKVRFTGTSTFSVGQRTEAERLSHRLGVSPFACEQSPYNLLDRRIEAELLPAALAKRWGVLVWSPLAEGILTGKYQKNRSLPPDSRYAQVTKPGLYAGRLTEPVFRALDSLRQIAESKSISLSQLSLAWCRQHAGVSSILLGPSKIEQLEENLDALSITLTPSELAAIDQIVAPAGYLSSYYEADFGPGRT